MKTPEKLSLIGGGILLVSGLTFSLKTQAGTILPKVSQGISKLTDGKLGSNTNGQNSVSQPSRPTTQQTNPHFTQDLQDAQKSNQQTGQWGDAKWYIDKDDNLHVGKGKLQGDLESAIGSKNAAQINTINLEGNVQAPQNSEFLFGKQTTGDGARTNYTAINGLNNLDTSQVQDFSYMFSFNNKLNNLDLSHFDTHNANTMTSMFYMDSSLGNLDLSHFDTHQVTNMSFMFGTNSNNLTNISGLDRLDTSKVNDMSYMFYNDFSLSNLDVSHFDTSNVNDMQYMFAQNNNLQSINLSHINTRNVNDMQYMFVADPKLSTVDLSHLDTSQVTNMEGMFALDNSIDNLNFSNFNTSQVTDMTGMFKQDPSIKSLNLSSFNTDKLNGGNVMSMLAFDSSLNYLNISSWNTSQMSDEPDMFLSSDNIHTVVLGNHTTLNDNLGAEFVNGSWQNGNQKLDSGNSVEGTQLADGNPHPGTWTNTKIDSWQSKPVGQ